MGRKMKTPAWLWLVLIGLWVFNIFLALANFTIPYLGAITGIVTLVGLLYAIYNYTEFKLGYEGIIAFGITGILILLAMAFPVAVTSSLQFGSGLSGQFLWEGSLPSLGGVLVAMIFTVFLAMVRRATKKKVR